MVYNTFMKLSCDNDGLSAIQEAWISDPTPGCEYNIYLEGGCPTVGMMIGHFFRERNAKVRFFAAESAGVIAFLLVPKKNRFIFKNTSLWTHAGQVSGDNEKKCRRA